MVEKKMSYEEFLEERRKLMASKIKEGYDLIFKQLA